MSLIHLRVLSNAVTRPHLENYSSLCTITVDLSQMGKALGPFKGANGRVYYKADFDIILLFGLTELKAQLCWRERVGIFIFRVCLFGSH